LRPEALILAFDTSAAHCAAALLSGDRIVAMRAEPMEKGQAERLMPFLEALLAEAGKGWADLTGLAVGTGPGNFTGVRIAVSAARGLALGLGILAVGITRLEAAAHGQARPVTVVLDARRDEVYVQTFTDTGDLPARVAAAAGQSLSPGLSAEALVSAMARIAATRLRTPQPRPAPCYLRGADAAPPSDPPPVILP
jgi:tRNA threonylcarbamoyladenosine biosynthesis protein TsaB